VLVLPSPSVIAVTIYSAHFVSPSSTTNITSPTVRSVKASLAVKSAAEYVVPSDILASFIA
jgi:hypothetical protein